MENHSQLVFSNQDDVHPDLEKVVQKHMAHSFLKIIRRDNQHAFENAMAIYQQFLQCSPNAQLILDSACGVGESSVFFAKENPQDFVLGVDQSLVRLNKKKKNLPPNLHFVRADLVDFWRLLAQHRIFLKKHYLLYPNPYPKKKHLQRRFHAHSVFPILKTLGGTFECRSNWQIYIQEMAKALFFLSAQNVLVENFQPQTIITPFERKYLNSAHHLWRCRIDFLKK